MADYRLVGKPVGVEWAGWRSDTYTLQRNGWKLAFSRDHYSNYVFLAMENKEMRLQAVTDTVSYYQMEVAKDWPVEMPLFRVRHVAPSIQVRVVAATYDWTQNAIPIDATPQYKRMDEMRDLSMIFAPFETRVEEVVINRADMTVIEHLEAIKRLQDPEQSAIRRRMLEEGKPARKDVIVQLADYRGV